MGATTGISWCDCSFNPVWGCAKVSPGCSRCYAESLAARYGHRVWGEQGKRRTFGPEHWAEPIAWNKKAIKEGRRLRVFCGSMCDVFEDHPVVDLERTKLWPLIRATPFLDWQLLTKRPEQIIHKLPTDWDANGYANVWLGVSVENQDYAHRITTLLKIPATLRFVSYEPALGPLKVHLAGISWVIAGGESGTKHRPMDTQWARDMRDQCKASGVAFFYKQGSHRLPGHDTKLDGELIQEIPVGRLPVPPMPKGVPEVVPIGQPELF